MLLLHKIIQLLRSILHIRDDFRCLFVKILHATKDINDLGLVWIHLGLLRAGELQSEAVE